MNARASLWMTAAALLAAGAAGAHHSAAQYDQTERLVLSGTLVKVNWTNPHVELLFDVRGEHGQVEAWRIESLPPNRFVAHDIGKSAFRDAIGQLLTIAVSPERDGARSGILRKVTFADGHVIDCSDREGSATCTRESPTLPR